MLLLLLFYLLFLKDLYELEDSLGEGEDIFDDGDWPESDNSSGLSQEG